jgi:acyl dehydratase
VTRSTLPPAVAGAPFFDDLRRGDVLDDGPTITVTDGLAATHQAIVGDRLRLPLDHELSRRVTHHDRPLAHPQLICDLAIGQSTQVTQRVVANLFYRGLAFRRSVRIGDTLRTVTTVEALKENARRKDRRPTGLAVLHMRTTDQDDRTVLDFRRCAMLPLSPDAASTGHADDVQSVPDALDHDVMAHLTADWDLEAFRAALPRGPHFAQLEVGQRWTPSFGDVISSAPELARLTLNVAAAHHDAQAAGGRRLVYGGHTIGVAAAQIARVLPNLVTVAGWKRCDHTGPVHEGDTLHGEVEVTDLRALENGGGLASLRVRLRAAVPDGEPPRDVLDWRLIGVMA